MARVVPDPKPVPVAITRANVWDVAIRWSDGHEAVYPAPYLRRACCCVVCLQAPVAEDPDVHPLAIDAVGTYAVHFEWSDGHAAGVYSYEYLRGLCPCPSCTARALPDHHRS